MLPPPAWTDKRFPVAAEKVTEATKFACLYRALATDAFTSTRLRSRTDGARSQTTDWGLRCCSAAQEGDAFPRKRHTVIEAHVRHRPEADVRGRGLVAAHRMRATALRRCESVLAPHDLLRLLRDSRGEVW